MDKPLNKREREFLKPAIVHYWEIEISPTRKTALLSLLIRSSN